MEEFDATSIRLVLTTEADRATAEHLAAALVEREVAACVTMIPVRSMFRWEGSVDLVEEVQLLIKTTGDRVAAVAETVGELHSYDLPEFVVLDAQASAAYGSWVATGGD